jgi:hypothetical protein
MSSMFNCVGKRIFKILKFFSSVHLEKCCWLTWCLLPNQNAICVVHKNSLHVTLKRKKNTYNCKIVPFSCTRSLQRRLGMPHFVTFSLCSLLLCRCAQFKFVQLDWIRILRSSESADPSQTPTRVKSAPFKVKDIPDLTVSKHIRVHASWSTTLLYGIYRNLVSTSIEE